jgi:hypothetical protein
MTRHGKKRVIKGNVVFQFGGEIRNRGKIAPSENMTSKCTKPDFNRVEPGTMLGSVDKSDAM